MAVIESLYSDGACKGNPGPGGWGAVAYFKDGSVSELGGSAGATTNNRMEMQAAIEALNFFIKSGQSESCALYTDSQYVIKGVTSWLKGWKSKSWKTAAGKPVLNQDLWEILDELSIQIRQQTKGQPLRWEYVKGHAGNVGNERCDVIASSYALGKPVPLRQGQTTPVPVNFSMTPIPPIEELPAHNGDHDNVPRGERVTHLHYLVDTLHIAEEIAEQGYFITSSELADLMDINASAVTSRGDHWVWRNWNVCRVRREGNQILWQLERVDRAKEQSLENGEKYAENSSLT
jgi:ribonuclease HI